MAPRTSTTTCASSALSSSSSSTAALDSERGTTSVHVAGPGRGSNPQLITGASPCVTATATSKSSQSSQSDSDFSPSTRTIEKLRSFKFIKTPNLKSKNVHTKRPPTSDDQSDLTLPPNKRRSIDDGSTNCIPLSNSMASCDNISRINTGAIFKQPSFNPRTNFNSLSCTPASSQSEGQSSNMGAKVTQTVHQRESPGSTSSTANFTTSQPNWHQSNRSNNIMVGSLPSTPTLSNSTPHVSTSVHGGTLSTPQSTPNSSQSKPILSTPQRAITDAAMQTLTRTRQTTPMVSTLTETGSGVATPIVRASMPLKRKFPGPAGLLPSLVCTL